MTDQTPPTADAPSLSMADIGGQLYTRDGFDPATASRKDPVNLLFAASIGTIGAVLRLVEDVLGCRASRPLSDQWFCEPGAAGPCHLQDQQRATRSLAVVTRYHARLYQLNRPEFGGDPPPPLTAAPIHREALHFCDDWWPPRPGHVPISDVPDSFDLARDWAKERLEADGTRRTQRVWLGNTEFAVQCDGTPVQGDGYAYIVHAAGDAFPALGGPAPEPS